MKCENCGHDNELDATYCEECGSKLMRTPSFGKSNHAKPKEGMITKNKILIVSVIVLVVVLGGMVGYLLKSSSTVAPNNTTGNTTNIAKEQISLSTGFPVSEVPTLAQEISRVGTGFSSINYSGVTLDKNQCLYILARGIVMINNGETGNIPIGQYGNPENPYGTVTSATIIKKDYVDMAQRTYTWMDNNRISPNYIGITASGQPDLSMENMLTVYSKVLTQYKSSGKLPESITFP